MQGQEFYLVLRMYLFIFLVIIAHFKHNPHRKVWPDAETCCEAPVQTEPTLLP